MTYHWTFQGGYGECIFGDSGALGTGGSFFTVVRVVAAVDALAVSVNDNRSDGVDERVIRVLSHQSET
jgi:hypothetical protein